MYLRMGMWVHMWKRELALRWDGSLPPARFEFEGDRSALWVELDGDRVTLERARRDGDRLVLEEHPPSDHPRIEALRWDSPSTFALGLALEGWPLIRSPQQWDRCHYADAGPPEALASRIVQWEAWNHKHGWVVDTPRIPGLEYPTWDELEARWARARALFEAERS